MKNELLWNDIGVEQPEDRENVLVLVEFTFGEKIVTGAYYSIENNDLHTYGDYDDYCIVLWMPLPAAAKRMID